MRRCHTINISTAAYEALLVEVARTGKSVTSLATDAVLRGLGLPPAAPSDEPEEYTLEVSEADETATICGATVHLSKRRVLAQLVYLFARNVGGEPLSKEQIAVELWRCDYHPLRHDPGVFSAIQRLRQLLRDEDNSILRQQDGRYWLAPPPGFRFTPRAK